jgi:hypothetical protein
LIDLRRDGFSQYLLPILLVSKQIDRPNRCRQLEIVCAISLDIVPPPQQAHDGKHNSSLSHRSLSQTNQLFPANDCGFVRQFDSKKWWNWFECCDDPPQRANICGCHQSITDIRRGLWLLSEVARRPEIVFSLKAFRFALFQSPLIAMTV